MAGQTKTRIVVAVLLLLTLVGVGVWWTQRGDDPTDGPAAGDQTKPDPLEAVRRKREARADQGPVTRVSVGGRVTRADDGAGIAGAVVLLSRKDLVQGQAPNPGESTLPLVTTTDANGGWQIPAIDPGRYLISATAVGYLPVTLPDQLVRDGANQPPINLAMEVGGALLSGIVTDIGGGPIEGVLIRLNDTSQMNLGFNQAPLAALTDEDGEYRLHVATGRYGVSTFHIDYVAEARATDVPDSGRREDFKLIPGGTIEGVVLARPDGTPVAGARVTFSDSRSGGFGGMTTNLSLDGSVVVSDEQGRFRVTGIHAGVVAIEARAAGHASVTPEEVPIGIGEQVSDVEIWVDTAYTIAGFVTPKGDPEGAIEGVLVGAWQMQPMGLLVAIGPTQSDGYFEIHGVPPGTWQVGALSEDHLLALTGATAVITDHDVRDLLIELETGIYVRGRVDPGVRARLRIELDPESVSLSNLGGTIGDSLATTVADEAGVFELGPIAPGTGFGGRAIKIMAESDEGFRGELTVELRREDLEGVVVSMTKGASVSGTVLDQNGVPQKGVVVSISPVKPAPGSPVMFGGFGSGGAPTTDEGKFSVRGLELGDHELVVKDAKGRAMSWAPGSGPPTAEPEAEGDEVPPLALAIEDTVNEQFLDLRVISRDAEITGVVLDAEGLPVPDAWVRANLEIDSDQLFRPSKRDEPERVTGVVPEDDDADEPDWTRSTYYSEPPVLTDQNGLFVIKDLRRDRNYHLLAEGERGGARATLESVAANSRVTLTLEQLGGIDGVVKLDGKPVADYQIRLTGPSHHEKRVAHPEGRFRLDRLDPGKYKLFVSSDAGTGEAEVELGGSGPNTKRASVEIELERAGTLRGRVIGDKDGEPIAGLRILVMDASGSEASAGLGILTGQGPKTDSDGKFEIKNVAPGKGDVSFVDPDAELSGDPEVATVDFDLDAGDDLDLGTITGLQGDAIPKAERGTLQMRLRLASWAERPRPPGTDLDAEEPAPTEGPDVDETNRLWVYSVDVGGVAEAAGIVPGDEVVTIDGQAVETMGAQMASSRLSSSRIRVGQSVRLELVRDGDDRIDVSLEAVAAPED